MAPGVWNGKDTGLVVEVCSGVCVCVCVCVSGDPGSRIPIFSLPFQALTLPTLRAERVDKRPLVYLLIGAVPSGRAVAASLDGTHSLSSVWLACWCSQRHKGTFWWVLWDPPITCFFEVGSSLTASFSYFPEAHNLLFLESSYLMGCSLGWQDFTKVRPSWLSQSMRELHIFLQRWDRGCFLALFLSVPPSFFPSSLTSQR